MAYPALPDHRVPFDIDGTLNYVGNLNDGATTALTDLEEQELQDDDFPSAAVGPMVSGGTGFLCHFFPHQSEVTGIYARCWRGGGGAEQRAITGLTGSNDTTNGLDGTWETASLPQGVPGYVDAFSWRSGIKAVSFTGPKKNVRVQWAGDIGAVGIMISHLYGEPAAGQMAHDLVFLDPDLGAGVAFPAPEDFGDQPLATTVVRPFRIKNTSSVGSAIAISSSSVANPTVITTSAAHGFQTGHEVTIAGHSGSTPSINGTHTVTVLSPTTFSIPVNVTVGGTGGTATRQARTATTINIQCNDADFTIGESASGPWVATINIASLAAGAESATLYTKCTTPAPGAALKPRYNRIVAQPAAGFFG